MVERDLPFGARASMEPVIVGLHYRSTEGGDVADVELPFKTSWEDASVFCEALFDGETVDVLFTPKTPIRIESVHVVLRHAFTSDEMVLLNGRQFWADASEHPAWAHAHFLKNMANRIARRQLLDDTGGGLTYATFRRGEGMVLVGSLDESRGFTRIDTHLAQGAVTLATECPEETLRTGVRVSLGRYAVIRGTARQCYDRWLELSGITPRPAKLLVGYSSRYLQGDAIDSAKLCTDIDSASAFFETLPEPIAGDAEKAFLVESAYCPIGDWLDYDKQRFPEGLVRVAQAARAEGFVPGIWIAPFVCHRDSRIFEEYPEWLLRDENGDPVVVGSSRGGVYALDTLNVDVRSYVLEVLQAMTREWGFRLIVAECLYAACLRAHGGRNRGELMADAIDLVRLGVGEDVAILACDVPLASAFGKVEYCRVSDDATLHWPGESKTKMFGRAPARNAASPVSVGALLDGRAFGIDVDELFEASAAGAQGARGIAVLAAAGSCGSVFLASDDMGSWDDDVRERYINAIVAIRGEKSAKKGWR